MIIMGQWTRVENNNEVLLRVTNHPGQAEKNLLGPAGIRTRDFRFEGREFESLKVLFSSYYGFKKDFSRKDEFQDQNLFVFGCIVWLIAWDTCFETFQLI